jgi:hypothetical protein
MDPRLDYMGQVVHFRQVDHTWFGCRSQSFYKVTSISFNDAIHSRIAFFAASDGAS